MKFVEKTITFVVYFIFIITILALCTKVLGTSLTNSDTLWMVDYLRDWLVRGVDMRTWQPAMAPNYFPEMLIFGLFIYGTKSVYLGFMVFRIAKALLYVFLFYKLLDLITQLPKIYKSWIAILLSTGMVLATIIIGNTQDFWQLYVPTAHGGAFVNSLIGIVLISYLLQNQKKNLNKALFYLFLLSIIAILSDLIFLVWFTIPVIVSFSFLTLFRQTPKINFVKIIFYLITPILILPIYFWLTPYRPVLTPAINQFEGWKTTFDLFLTTLSENTIYQIIVVFSFFCLVGITVFVFFKNLKKRTSISFDQISNKQETINLFLLFYACFITPMSFVSMAILDRPAPQYLMGGDLSSLLLFPFILILTSFGQKLLRSHLFYISVIFLVILGFEVSFTLSPPTWVEVSHSLNPFQQIYPTLVSCLDSHSKEFNNGAGVADYWEVRQINLFSKKGLRVDNVVAGKLSPLPVQAASNREMFENKKRTWVITDTISAAPNIRESDMIRWQGKPTLRFICAGYPILVYQNGINIVIKNNTVMDRPSLETKLTNFINKKINDLTLDQYDGMQTAVGTLDMDTVVSNGEAGYLQFGPYITLPQGNYLVEWQGKLVQAKNSVIGYVDVSENLDAESLAYAKVNIPTPKSPENDVLVTLQFSAKQTIKLTQFRFYVTKDSIVRLEKIVISRH